MKYIMFAMPVDDESSINTPIVFPDWLTHDQVAARMQTLLPLSKARVVSAGSVEGLVVLATSGKSVSLGDLASRPGDATLINTLEYAHGLELPNAKDIEHLVLCAQAKAIVEKLSE